MVTESFDWTFVLAAIPKLAGALPLTLGIAVVSMIAGCLVGLLLTFGKLSRFRLVRVVVNEATAIVRGIPTIVLLYLSYFALPFVIYRITGQNISGWSKSFFVVVALGTELAVTCSEMFRSAYNSLDKGQMEAAHSIGMTRVQRFFHIILPQGLYVILPNLGNAALAVIQGTALAYTLGVMDVMGKANVLNTNAFGLKTLEAFVVVALLYWGISLLLNMLFRLLERWFGRGQAHVAAV